MYGLQTADAMVRSGTYRRVLVVGSEAQSRFTDYADRATCILFGDGAGAVVVGAAEEGSDAGIVRILLGADSKGNELITIRNNYPNEPERSPYASCPPYIKMNGREVYKFATRVMVSSATAVLNECGKTIDEVDVYVPHQANKRIIDHAVGKLGVPHERTVVNVDRYGNTSSGSIPLALADARADGRLREGALVLMTGMGAGLTWGSALLEWSAPNGKAA